MSTPSPRKMTYVRLGNSGLKVSRLILGCMSYGSPEWAPWVLGEEEGIQHIKAAYDLGIQTFDTSNNYSNGISEAILGKAIKQHNLPRDEIVVMTKVNQHGLSRKHIFESVKHSLERLQLDYIDVLQCHRFDPDTPIEETMQALHDVVKAGYVRYVGMSSCMAWQYYAVVNKLTPFISMQNHYNLCYREEEREMQPSLKHFGVGCIPWSPLAMGVLTRPLSASNDTARGKAISRVTTLYLDGGGDEVVTKVQELAEKKGVSMAQISLAWLLQKEGVSAPIIGTTSLEKLNDLVAALDVKLDAEEVKALEGPYKAKGVFY
ncbi:Aldo/keto reductase [Amylostereum chailletii]|nr:Aldo/keto reductase [Amylostereum chailletii]